MFAAVCTALMTLGGDDSMPPISSWDKYFVLLNFVTALALGLSLIVFFSAIRTWSRATLRFITKTKYAVVAIACLFLSWFAIHWHLLGPVRF